MFDPKELEPGMLLLQQSGVVLEVISCRGFGCLVHRREGNRKIGRPEKISKISLAEQTISDVTELSGKGIPEPPAVPSGVIPMARNRGPAYPRIPQTSELTLRPSALGEKP